MLFTFAADKTEMLALQKAGVEIQGLATVIAHTFGETNVPALNIPTIHAEKTKKFGGYVADISPESCNVVVTIEPEFTAEVIEMYVKAYGPVAISAAQFISAIMKLDTQLEASQKKLSAKWFKETKKAKKKAA